MLVSVVQPAGARRYAAAAPPPSTTVQCPAQRWCYRTGSPTVTRAQPAQVLRQRRATVATGSPEATATWENWQEVAGTAPRRLTQVRPVEAVQRRAPPRVEPENEKPTPPKVPSAWSDRYELCENHLLGWGAFSEVYKVQHRFTGTYCAVKVMHRPNFTLRGIEAQIENEVTSMRMVAKAAENSPSEGHVVRLLDYTEECEYVYLLLEFCDDNFLQKLSAYGCFTEDTAAMWAHQLLLGLQSVHSAGWIHRDIKPDNLLCAEGNVLKLADFGWCSTVQEAPTSLAGTFTYMAPEVLSNHPQTTAVDVWSAGIVLYQMLMGQTLLQTDLSQGATQLTNVDPYRATAIKQERLLAEIAHTCPPSDASRPPHLSELCWGFLRQLLNPKVSERITVDAALRHPWIRRAAGRFAREVTRNVVPEVTRNVVPEVSEPENEPEETTKENSAPLEVPPSPPCNKVKDARSPLSPSCGSPNSVENVPTPLKPRCWDPHRNIAYTPPLETSVDITSVDIDDIDNHSTPEVSPQRKALLHMSADRVSTFDLSREERIQAPLLDDLDRTQPARAPLSRLSPPAPPPRTLGRRLGGSALVQTRSRGAYESSAVEGESQLLTGSTSALLRQPRLAAPPRLDHRVTNELLRTLHSAGDQMRQLKNVLMNPPDQRLQGLNSGHDSGYPGEVTALDSTAIHHDMDHLVGGFDVLTATAPPLIGHSTPGMLMPSRVLDATTTRIPIDGLPSARGRENMLPQNPIAVGSPHVLKGKPMVRNGVVCYAAAPRYTPLSATTKAGQPPPSASRIASALQPQQGQRYVLQVPTNGVPQLSTPQATMWAAPAGASPLRMSGVQQRPGRASVPGQWACER